MYILGIHDGHDASAALFKNGKIIAAVQEERFSRLKGDYGYPKHSIEFCLKHAGKKSKDIDFVALSSFNSNPVLTYLKRNANFSVSDWVEEQERYWKPLKFKNEKVCYYDIFKNKFKKTDKYYNFDGLLTGYMDNDIMKEFLKRRIEYISKDLNISKDKIIITNHEQNHQFYAIFASPFRQQNVLILTAEGIGDKYNGTVSVFKNGKITNLVNMEENHLGHFYQYITLILGMKPAQHEYKVMGLAPYANDYETQKAYNILKKYLKVDGMKIKFNEKPQDLYFTIRDELKVCRFDGIAAGVQKFLENILCKWVKNCVSETGIRKLVLAGGVAQNIKAMKAVAELDCVEDIYVPPASGDTSNSIGACFNVAYNNKLKIEPFFNIYLGPSFCNHDIEKELKNLKGDFVIKNVTNKEIAKILAMGNIVGIVRGRSEFGLRALGNRSILADPKELSIIDKINQCIKFRDFWMPFTPSVIDYRAKDYIKNPKNLYTPFMTMAFDSVEKNREDFFAAMHPADKTVRPQIVSKEINPIFYDLLQEFEKITGRGVLLNTSFNLHGEPIVLTPKDAIYTFNNSQLDALVLENILVIRRENEIL